MAVLHNKPGTTVVVHATANSSWTIAGNNSVSNVALAGEELTGASIRQIWFGSVSSDSSVWVIKRGANVVFVVDETGYIDFSGTGHGLDLDASANLAVELHGNTTGSIMIELKKIGSFPSKGY